MDDTVSLSHCEQTAFTTKNNHIQGFYITNKSNKAIMTMILSACCVGGTVGESN